MGTYLNDTAWLNLVLFVGPRRQSVGAKFCEACSRRGIQSHVTTLCNECRELFCKNCSDVHVSFRSFQDHTLIDLGLMSTRTIREDNIKHTSDSKPAEKGSTSYSRAQSALGTTRSYDADSSKSTAIAKERKIRDASDLKVNTHIEFCVTGPDDGKKVNAKGIILIAGKIVFANGQKKTLTLELFSENGDSFANSQVETKGIARTSGERFVTCGEDKVMSWTLSGKTIRCDKTLFTKKRKTQSFVGIHCNGSFHFVLDQIEKNGDSFGPTRGTSKGNWNKKGFR